MDVLLTIGEFSKMTYLSVKALRHYHEVGLLEPVAIDASSGYRRYGASQVATAQAIRRFRDLDMPLDDVRSVLEATDEDARNRVIVDHLSRLQAQLERTQQSVTSLQALLTDGPRPAAEVALRHLVATPALAQRRRVGQDESSDWLTAAFVDLHVRLDRADLVAAGVDGALWPDEFFEDDAGLVTAFVPLTAAPTGWALEAIGSDPARGGEGASRSGPPVDDGSVAGREGDVEVIRLPAATVAVLVHDGPFVDADQTYGALGTVVAERGIGEPGPIREHYLAEDRIEVCWPVSVGRPT